MLEYKLSVLYYGVDDVVNNHEYITNDIFANYKNIEYDFLLVGQEDQIDKVYDVLIYNCTNPERYNHFGFSPTYEQTKNAVLKFKPKVIIQLADEYYNEHNEIHNFLGHLCNLFLRQHRHGSQIYSYNKNVCPIPLGYANGIKRDGVVKVKPMKDRKYNWSWVGNMKSDRNYMISTFWRMWKSVVISNAYLPTNEVFDLYSDSIFVPCGRGNISLDCFRLYETTVAGAIPVIVGPSDEIDYTFNFFDEKPPWIYGENWEEVIYKCQLIECDFDTLQNMQDTNIDWWNRTLNNIHLRIKSALSEELRDHAEIMNYLSIQEKTVETTKSIVWYYT